MNAQPPLPDRTTAVAAASALIVAPHFDDEVLGCGGLAVQLVAAGAAVRVLFLSDGGGGEAGSAGDAYRRRRREEAAAVAEFLGFAGCHRLDLPDGALAGRLPEIAAGLRCALLAQRPELLLVPSPLELSADHRAAFAALHHLLAPVRPSGRAARGDAGAETGGDRALAEAVRDLRVLVYEVNRPAHPDLLVDVGGELPRLAAAMALYASQQERHDYWRAAAGLRRFRTLTLARQPAGGADAAEGYRALAVADLVTRSPAQLVRHLGGEAERAAVEEGPLVSVVVRTTDRPRLLAEALASLATGSYRQVEVVLVNDGGAPPAVPDGYPFPVRRVELAENRGRAGAADAGVAAATGDYVAFLDDDDLAAPEHLATLVGLVAAADVRVAYTDAAVGVYELEPGAAGTTGAPGDGGGWVCRERRLPYSRDFDPDLLLVDNYIPFNTLLVARDLFAEVGPFDRDLPFFEDWDFLIRLAACVPFHHLPRVTCEYRHFRGAGHHVLGETPRRRADFLAMKARVLAKHARELAPERLAAAVDTLRGELVDAAEEAAGARRERTAARAALAAAERERVAAVDRFHRLNGEAVALRADGERLRAEAQRLYDAERELRAAVADQDAHLGRTYAEIERLNALVREMEGTRAWRLHRRFSRGKRG
jgi:LmbE family N-acetylglucosaminyl deacetylase/glycosyltransferase involved in cell wall biosynthesis